MLALLAISSPPFWTTAQEKKPATPVRNRWERGFYGLWEQREVLLFKDSIRYGKLTFGDLDGDGDQDLLVGKMDGRIDFFRNEGTAQKPNWRLVQENIRALTPGPNKGESVLSIIDVGAHAAPALVDIDQDNDLDLFVGTADGRLLLYQNIGNPVLPSFVLANDNFISRAFGTHLVPFFADVDNNRTPDLVVGNQKGEVFLLINQGSRTQHRAIFCGDFPSPDADPNEEPPCRPIPQRLLTIARETDATPGMTDWDGDGDLDLFVGKSDGTISYYENKGTAVKGRWTLVQKRFLAIDEGGYAAPVFQDVNNDGKPDMIIGSSTDGVSLYTYQGTPGPMDIWKVTGNWLNIQRMAPKQARVVVASGDLDGDKDLDLILGTADGALLFLENIGSPTHPAWRARKEKILAEVARKNAAPWLVDLDGDGDLDLLVGGADGQLWFLRNKGGPKAPRFVLESTRYAGIKVGNDSIPVAHDLDRDGKPDLFVGNRKGLVIYYRNTGTATAPRFMLASTRFGNLTVKRNAAPAFFDQNGDKKDDLVVGAQDGLLVLTTNNNPPKNSDLRSWQRAGERWGEFKGTHFSAPHFADLNNDGKVDLLLSDADGNIQLWWNRGQVRTAKPTVAKAGANGNEATEQTINDTQTPTSPTALVPEAPDALSASGLKDLEAPPDDGAVETGNVSASLSTPQDRQGPIEPEFALVSKKFGDLQVEGRAAPSFGDVDGDGDLDLVMGAGNGNLYFYRNVGDKKKPVWEKVTDKLAGFNSGRSPAPLLHDLDGDGKVDLIVGTERGQLLFYKNTGQNPKAPFTLVKGALGGINVRRNASPAVAFVDKDDRADLVVGNFSGTLVAFVQVGKAHSLNFKLHDRGYLGLDVGIAATPFVGDIDRDKAPDMLIGSDQGAVSLFTRGKGREKANAWGWAPGKGYLKNIKFPLAARPVLADLDGDGDMDLFVGMEKGTIFYYRNDAVKSE